MESSEERKPSSRAFFTSFSLIEERTQLAAEFALLPLVIMAVLDAQCLTRIYNLGLGALCAKNTDVQIGNGGGGEEKELVNCKKPPTLPIYIFSMKEHGLRRGKRSRSGSPLTGRKKLKLPCYP
jgi:hypothetical protein